MTELLLIFLGAAYLDNLALIAFFDRPIAAPVQGGRALLVVAGLLLALLATLHGIAPESVRIPPPAQVYLSMLAFTTTILALAQSTTLGATVVRPRLRWLRWLRKHLPLLVANLAVLAFVLLESRHAHRLPDTVGFCLGASLVFHIATVLYSPMRERIEVADVPRRWRGAPIALVTAGLIALALTGYAASLPW
jgi:electron transport complex protein RnfA